MINIVEALVATGLILLNLVGTVMILPQKWEKKHYTVFLLGWLGTIAFIVITILEIEG